jgi:hypothetical protein
VTLNGKQSYSSSLKELAFSTPVYTSFNVPLKLLPMQSDVLPRSLRAYRKGYRRGSLLRAIDTFLKESDIGFKHNAPVYKLVWLDSTPNRVDYWERRAG